MARVYRRILDTILPERWQSGQQKQTWSQAKMLDRYSQRLFADVLAAGGRAAGDWPALEQALVVAGRENAQVYGLHAAETGENTPAVQAIQQIFERRCQETGTRGHLAVEAGELVDRLYTRAVVADLVILDRTLTPAGDQSLEAAWLDAIQRCARPVLVVPGQPTPLERVLLSYDGSAKAREALFVAAYVAEQWGVALTVLTVLEPGRTDAETAAHARTYLAMHEVEATFLVEAGPVAATILEAAVTHDCDLIVVGGYSGRGRPRPGHTVQQILQEGDRPLLICP